MNREALSPDCEAALAALQNDPLDLPAEVEAHLRACAPCREARIVLLAQEEAPLPLAPAGYFERLPGRILGKLPAKRALRPLRPWMLAAAAVLLLAVSGISFFAGRANPATPVAKAETAPSVDQKAIQSTLPFQDSQDDLGRLKELNADEMKALIEQLEKESAPRSE